MVKRPLLLLLAAAFACSVAACKNKNAALSAAEAQIAFQNKQRLALIKVYDDLAKKYPESANASRAKERAAALRAQAGPQGAAPAKK